MTTLNRLLYVSLQAGLLYAHHLRTKAIKYTMFTDITDFAEAIRADDTKGVSVSPYRGRPNVGFGYGFGAECGEFLTFGQYSVSAECGFATSA